MNYFLKANKNFMTYSLILLITIPIFGIKFFLSFLGNILILLFLIPVLLLLLVFLGFNFFKSKVNVCDNCGAISLGMSNRCNNCGAEIEDISKENKIYQQPCDSTIEVKAEEVK